MLLHILLFTLYCLSHLTSTSSISSPISYQIHSYDDLRQWPQTLMKGATWLKIDPHYALPETCSSISRINPNPSIASLGCFLLVHDTPVTTRTTFYNTTDDVLDMISAKQNRVWYANPNRRIYIALCFKYDSQFGDVCAASTASTSWRTLIDDFVTRALNIIAANGLNVEFILDGEAVPRHTCLANRWRPLNATFITTSDPSAGGSTDDVSKGYDRYAINNMQEASLWWYQLFKYGKFSNPTRTVVYPFLVWEPSDEPEIVKIASTYLQADAYHNPLGLRFAINIDPLMFTLYSSSIPNAHLDSLTWQTHATAHDLSPTHIGNSVTYPRAATYVDQDGVIHIAQGYTSDGQLSYIWYKSSSITSSPIISTQPTLVHDTTCTGSWTSWHVVELKQGPIIFAGCDTNLIPITPTSTTTIPLPTNNTLPYISSSFTILTSDDNIWMIRVASTEKCDAVIQVLSLDQATFTPTIIIPDICLNPFQNHVTDIQVAAYNTSGIEQNICHSGSILVYVSYSIINNQTNQPHIQMQRACINPITSEVTRSGVVSADVGRSPSLTLSISPSTSRLILTLVATDSYCYNSHKHNTRATPAMCDQQPTSLSQVLSYSMGEVDEWEEWLRQGLTTPTLLTSCAPSKIVHGTYGMGQFPHITTLNRACDSVAPCIISTHVGNSAKDTGGCGQATMYDTTSTLVMHAWPRFLQI